MPISERSAEPPPFVTFLVISDACAIHLACLDSWWSKILLERKKTVAVWLVCSSLTLSNYCVLNFFVVWQLCSVSQCLPCFASTFSPDMPCVPHRGQMRGAAAMLRASQVGPVRPTMGHQPGMVWPMDNVAMKQIPQKRSAALTMQRDCGMRAPSTSVAGCQQLAKVESKWTYASLGLVRTKRWTHAAPTNQKLWRFWKLVKTAMPSFVAMREVANGKATHNLATSWVPGHRGRSIPWTATRGVGARSSRRSAVCHCIACGQTAWATGGRITGSISTSRHVDAWARINVEMSWADETFWDNLRRKNPLRCPFLTWRGWDACKIDTSGSHISCHIANLFSPQELVEDSWFSCVYSVWYVHTHTDALWVNSWQDSFRWATRKFHAPQRLKVLSWVFCSTSPGKTRVWEMLNPQTGGVSR